MINSDVTQLFAIIPQSAPVWIGSEAKLKEWGVIQPEYGSNAAPPTDGAVKVTYDEAVPTAGGAIEFPAEDSATSTGGAVGFPAEDSATSTGGALCIPYDAAIP